MHTNTVGTYYLKKEGIYVQPIRTQWKSFATDQILQRPMYSP